MYNSSIYLNEEAARQFLVQYVSANTVLNPLTAVLPVTAHAKNSSIFLCRQ